MLLNLEIRISAEVLTIKSIVANQIEAYISLERNPTMFKLVATSIAESNIKKPYNITDHTAPRRRNNRIEDSNASFVKFLMISFRSSKAVTLTIILKKSISDKLSSIALRLSLSKRNLITNIEAKGVNANNKLKKNQRISLVFNRINSLALELVIYTHFVFRLE